MANRNKNSNIARVPWNKGKTGFVVSEETKEKMRQVRLKRKERLGYLNSSVARKKMSIRGIGRKHTEETKVKLSRVAKSRDISRCDECGKIIGSTTIHICSKSPWNKGLKFSDTPQIYTTDWTNILREQVRERDDFLCQECGIHQDELGGWLRKHDVHHIDYDKFNCNPSNLITLCRICHSKTNYNRDYWLIYFKNE